MMIQHSSDHCCQCISKVTLIIQQLEVPEKIQQQTNEFLSNKERPITNNKDLSKDQKYFISNSLKSQYKMFDIFSKQ